MSMPRRDDAGLLVIPGSRLAVPVILIELRELHFLLNVLLRPFLPPVPAILQCAFQE